MAWEDLTPLEQQQSFYSDYYKDVVGLRPRPNEAQWNSLEWLDAQVQSLSAQMDRRHETFWDREELREEFWHVPEDAPHVQALADYFAAMREAEMENWTRPQPPRPIPIEQRPYPYEEYEHLERRWA